MRYKQSAVNSGQKGRRRGRITLEGVELFNIPLIEGWV